MKVAKWRWLLIVLLLVAVLSVPACTKPTLVHVYMPEDITVPAGTSSLSLLLPSTLVAEFSDGSKITLPVSWDTDLLPPVLVEDVVVPGKCVGGHVAEVAIKVVQGDPCISAEEAAGAQAAEYMQQVLEGDPRVSFLTWSRGKQMAAFVLEDLSLHIWRVGDKTSSMVSGANASCCGGMAWSHDDRYFWVDSGTGPDRGCMIVDAEAGEVVDELYVLGSAVWAPDRNVLLLGLLNREIELFWRSPEYAVEMAVYDLQTGVTHILQSATAECEYEPIAWDEPQRITYRRRWLNNYPDSQEMTYAIGEVTLDPALPQVQAVVAADPELLNQQLQLAGMRDICWSPDQEVVAFLTASDCYLWRRLQPAPERLDLVEGGFGQLHHLSWSPDSKYLAVHEGSGDEANLKVIAWPDLEIILDTPIYTLAYWSPVSAHLLLAVPSGCQPGLDFIAGYVADLLLYEPASGQRQVLLTADGSNSYRPLGWANAGEVFYDHIQGRMYRPQQTLAIAQTP
ncbi:MAG: hypothetical protein ACOX2K_10245 [Bacillota bacterium]